MRLEPASNLIYVPNTEIEMLLFHHHDSYLRRDSLLSWFARTHGLTVVQDALAI